MMHATGTFHILWLLLAGLAVAGPLFWLLRYGLRGRMGQRLRRGMRLGRWQPQFLERYEPGSRQQIPREPPPC